jgi:hypothetical protein
VFQWILFGSRQVLAVVTTAVVVSPLAAQVRGHVIDPAAAPLAGALVEIWSPTTRLAARVSDAEGAFLFGEGVARTAVLITVRRIGYQPARVPVTPNAVATIKLVPFPQSLATVTVTATRLCPNVEDTAAHAVWEAMRHRYQLFRPELHVWSPTRMIFARVQPPDLGAIDTTQAVEGEVAAGGNYFDAASRQVVATGYATAYQGLRQQRFENWEYPRLESFFAGHFMDSLFGEQHQFSVASRAPLVLVFCPRSTKRPSIQGRLEIEADTSLGKATWVFQTPEPREEAGGEVIFGRPATDAVRPILLPLIGLYWRKLIFDYYQEWMQFEGWRFCRDDPDPRCRRVNAGLPK